MLRFVGRVVRGLIAAVVLAALVAGLPWVLVHYIGWPLPNHVPTGAEVHNVLLGPLTTTFLLDFLACAIWIVWAAFTLDVLRCTTDAARDLARGGGDAARVPDFSAAGPMYALAGVLVGAILLSVLGDRPAPVPAASLSSALALGVGREVLPGSVAERANLLRTVMAGKSVCGWCATASSTSFRWTNLTRSTTAEQL